MRIREGVADDRRVSIEDSQMRHGRKSKTERFNGYQQHIAAGGYRLSKRVTQELLSDFLGVRLALGSVCNIEREVSEALDAPVEEARAYVRQQPVVHADETGWREAKGRAWLWTAASPLVTVFQIAKSRGAGVAKQMLGENLSGFLVVDRWAAYEWVPLRQLCWSHLLRDFQGFVDRGGQRRPVCYQAARSSPLHVSSLAPRP